MRDEYFMKIKNRMLLRSMELWGIKDKRSVDPILDLLLHTFAYEISKLHQQVDVSDKELLDRLSRILVSNKWSLPSPSHALLKAQPEDDTTQLYVSDHFYCSKRRFGEEKLDVFFTPIIAKQLINASVKYLGYDDKLQISENQFGNIEDALYLSQENKIKDYELWFGVEISNELLEETNNLSLCFILKDSSLLPFLKTMKVYDVDGNEMFLDKEELINKNSEVHYFDDVVSFYEDCFYTLSLNESCKSKKTITELFGEQDDFFVEPEDLNEKLLWFKVKLPEVFSKDKLQGIDVSLNTFPVVNRKLEYKQHNFRKNGRILSVLSEGVDYFLNIESLNDDKGNSYANVIGNSTESLEGGYSLYFGDIGRFDTRSAKMMLSKTSQTVREEGSAFSSIGYDIIQAYLDDLHEKLDEIDKKIHLEFGEVNATNDKTFLLTYPHKEAFNYEFQYWLTNASQANGINTSYTFNQYRTGKFIDSKIKLKTDTIGGYIRKEEHDKINGLRYGLLTRERIVTREDVKSFVNSKIGRFVEEISIKDGVAISKEKKKGLIRTTDIYIKTKKELISKEKQTLFSYYLEKELEKRSISNITYKVFFI
ncbi:type VI secretion system baseplate subunit TssF [Tenacibaculum discolor]|uniref:Type VI secretion system baseplate subunit TssF n=2 Tax=Tenacibaculum discolor TaxID=361581 RepID=A0ABT9F780_9FLAO|nr:type VI secretion system baseplate subunit TssF [Tenacibaculum discolor]MDP2542577.1 type VI secretion system baseplate subunit TssF [Tenacibaculum discolor]